MRIHDGLEGIIGIRGLGGERLAEPSYALRSNLQKLLSLPSERDQELLSSVFYTPAAKLFFIRHLAGPRHISPTEVRVL